MKLLWKLISSILVYIFNGILVFALIALPIISFVTDHTNPEKLVDLLTSSGLFAQAEHPAAFAPDILLANGSVADITDNANLDTLLKELRALADSGIVDIDRLMKDLDISANAEIDREQLIQDLTESQAMHALLTAYTEDILNSATGTGENSLTSETVMEIISPHIEEIATIVQNNLPDDLSVDQASLTNAITKAVNDTLPALIGALPSAEEIANALSSSDVLSYIIRSLHLISSGQLRLIAIGCAVMLAVLIFLLRLPKFTGLRRIGTTSLFSAVMIGVFGYLLQAKPLIDSLQKIRIDPSDWAMPLLSALSSTFVSFAIFYGIAGISLILGYGILSILSDKKK